MRNIVIHVNDETYAFTGSTTSIVVYKMSRLHIMLYIIDDSHSKFIEARVTLGCTFTIITNKLRESISTHGITDTMVSDNVM